MNIAIVDGCFGTLQIKYLAFITSNKQNNFLWLGSVNCLVG